MLVSKIIQMRIIYLSLLFYFSLSVRNSCAQQDTIFTYTREYGLICNKRQARDITKEFFDNDGNWVQLETYKNNKPKKLVSYKTKEKEVLNGSFIEYALNYWLEDDALPEENIHVKGSFKDGLMDGTWTEWDWDGEFMLYEKNYNKGIPHGSWTTWGRNMVLDSGCFNQGARIGKWKIRFTSRTSEAGNYYIEAEFKDGKPHGLWQSWYNIGVMRDSGRFENGARVGEWNFYFSSGKMAERSVFRNDSTIQCIRWNNAWGDERRELSIEEINQKEPQFPGGEEALNEWIRHHLVYPKEALQNGVTGIVYASFVVEVCGNLGDIKILRSANDIFSEEVLRLLANMPKWEPGMLHTRTIPMKMVLPIHFGI